MNATALLTRALALLAVAGTVGCVTRPPTIAHVHIGHALTAVHVTPGHKGYILVAEQRADLVLAAIKSAGQASDLDGLKAQVALAVNENDNQDCFGVKQ